MRKLNILLGLALAYAVGAACGGNDKGDTDNNGANDGANDDNDGNDTFHTGALSFGITPVAVGFELAAILNDDGTLADYKINGEDYVSSMYLTLGSEAFFNANSQAEQDQESCVTWGPWKPEPRATDLPNIHDVDLFHSFEAPVVLEFHNCTNLDADWGTDGERVSEVFDGMRLGIGFGPMTDYLREQWSDEALDEDGDAMFATYIAINDPDLTFDGDDWTTGIVWEADLTSGEVVVDSNNYLENPIVVDFLPEGSVLPGGYVANYAYWYQDFPLMDFDVLKDGA